MGPLLLKPNLISPVWSGGAINRLRGIEGDVAYGESFDVSVHRGLVNDVEGGPYNGTPLDELLAGHRAEIMGDLTDDGVIQIITMSAAQSLSVQVHPDEAYAQAHEDDHEKTESWYIVEAEPGATIILGSETDDIDALRAAAADDTIGDKYGRRVPVTEGDFIRGHPARPRRGRARGRGRQPRLLHLPHLRLGPRPRAPRGEGLRRARRGA